MKRAYYYLLATAVAIAAAAFVYRNTPEPPPLAFYDGDAVMLRGGGPVMTISGYWLADHKYDVVWIGADGKLREAGFREDVLMGVKK
jgi:uncharacterized protein YodC (DUF2158 family)